MRELSRHPNRLARGVLVLLIICATSASAHPEDEFCVPGEDALDPALCAALAALDNPNADVSTKEIQTIVDASGEERRFLSTALLYVGIGFKHILPGGWDHILFVLAIFLAAQGSRALILQLSAFTVAHTATLGLVASGVFSPPSAIIELLIAATIVAVAIENLFAKQANRWRPLVIFAFGLLHGMGFAGFFGELGLPSGQFWSALLGFNVGVEFGQVAVVVAAYIASLMFQRRIAEKEKARQYRRIVVLPGSLLIAVTALWWIFDRWPDSVM